MKRTYELASQRIRESMAGKNASIRDLAKHLHLSYKDTRSIIHGWHRPSESILERVCEYLNIQPQEIMRLFDFDELSHELSSSVPSFAPMERFWRYLSEEHRQDLVCLARRWAAQDRSTRRTHGLVRDEDRQTLAAGSS